MNLGALYSSGSVRRWHQNPALAATGQTLADHVGRCLQLLLALHPAPTPALIRAVAFHDVGELVVGDLSADSKRRLPQLADLFAEAEVEARRDIVGPDDWLTQAERNWLNFLDRLEPLLWVAAHRPDELRRNGWPAAMAGVLRAADSLRVGRAVRDLLDDMGCEVTP